MNEFKQFIRKEVISDILRLVDNREERIKKILEIENKEERIREFKQELGNEGGTFQNGHWGLDKKMLSITYKDEKIKVEDKMSIKEILNFLLEKK